MNLIFWLKIKMQILQAEEQNQTVTMNKIVKIVNHSTVDFHFKDEKVLLTVLI